MTSDPLLIRHKWKRAAREDRQLNEQGPVLIPLCHCQTNEVERHQFVAFFRSRAYCSVLHTCVTPVLTLKQRGQSERHCQFPAYFLTLPHLFGERYHVQFGLAFASFCHIDSVLHA